MTGGPWRDRHDPMSPKANPHWAAMYAAKRRAIDRALLAACERALAEVEQTGSVRTVEADQACSEVERFIHMRRHAEASPRPSVSLAEPTLDQDAKTAIARAFGRPIK